MISAEEPSRSRLDECFLTGRYQSPPPTLVTFFPEVHTSSQYYGTPPLVSHPSFCFSCSHIRWRRWRKSIRAPASSGWVCGRTSLCFPPSRSATAGTQASQGAMAQAPLWWNQPWVLGLIPAAESSSVADPLETGPPLLSEQYDIASPARVIGPEYVAARREPFVLPERVLNTMPEARAPSSRRLYALKWAIFSTWCQGRDLVPVTSDVSVVLSFQQEMLDNQHSSSTIKVYAAAIASFHACIAGRLVARDSAVIQFLRGARRMNPLRPRTVPPWNLPTVLRALKGPPFEPLQSSSLCTLVENRPAVTTGVGQASRRPAGPFRQPCLPGIWAQRLQGRPETKAGLCT